MPPADSPDALLAALPYAALRLRRLGDPLAWRARARPEQLPAAVTPHLYLRGGRGSGKTWAGAHGLAEVILTAGEGEYAIVAPTYGDGRDVCVEGPSGLLRAMGSRVRQWNRSMGEVYVSNGAIVYIDGADDGALRVQGRNLRAAWADEVGLWKRTRWEVAWRESLGFAVRVPPARIIATGTPKRGHPLVRELLADPTFEKRAMRTEDNAANLDPAWLERVRSRFEGTVLGRQEMGGEVLEDSERALWRRGHIRYRDHLPTMTRVVVGVDPAVTSSADSDETGIVVVGRGADGLGYVLGDSSMVGTPSAWARKVVAAFRGHQANLVIAEANNGGDLVREVLTAVDANLPVTLVHAARGKQTRAEPVAALYEQARVFHAEPLPELEDQMCNWDPTDASSPDRMDALVWAMSGLMLADAWGSGAGSAIA